ncbi:MAG TPA: DUF3566 domain-containing protein [Acidimicrobiia bacterium]|nr:DUF3566 domain-containing protein [Acidimicrobiia bacterium]
MARARAVLETEAAPAPARARTRGRATNRTAARRSVPAPARRPEARRYRQTIRSVDLWTVLKISVCFYLCALIVLLAAGAVLWWIGSSFGVIENIESFIEELTGWDEFEFLSWPILRGATLLGLVFVCLLVVGTTLAAALYNLFSELLGGIEIVVAEDEEPLRR